MPLKDKTHYNEYMKKYQLNRYYKRRQEAIIYLGSKCSCCGSTENLDFDHVDKTTKILTISKIWSYSNNKFKEELGKCQLLCKDCHHLKSLEYGDYLGARSSIG